MLRSNLLHVDGLDLFPVAAVRESLNASGFAIVRGIAEPDEVRSAMRQARAAFDVVDDHPVVGETPADVRRNFQKWSIGTGRGEHRERTYARLIRVIFTPLFDDDRYGLHDLLRRIAVVRNQMLGLPPGYAIDCVEEGKWTAARILQYPVGGGFIDAHVDTATVDAVPSGAANYIQILMVLTERGVDYERGGAYLDFHGERVDLESHVALGDLVLYDEQTVHGVADIDPHRLFDTSTLCGRVAGFANLYSAL